MVSESYPDRYDFGQIISRELPGNMQKGKKLPEYKASLYILTVVYNRTIREICSWERFTDLHRKYPGVRLIVADNSTEGTICMTNRKMAEDVESELPGFLCYVNSGGNVGLSKAYNLGIARVQKDPDAWIMLSDDDTLFSAEYLRNVYYMINRVRTGSDLSVLCGVVETADTWISPRTERTAACAAGFMLKKPVPGIYTDLAPINSGLCLRLKVVRQAGGFDERLFLDQVDFLIMDRIRREGFHKVGVLPGKIRQSFSAEESTPEQEKRRWEIFRKDFRIYCKLSHKSWFYQWYLLTRRKMALILSRQFRKSHLREE